MKAITQKTIDRIRAQGDLQQEAAKSAADPGSWLGLAATAATCLISPMPTTATVLPAVPVSRSFKSSIESKAHPATTTAAAPAAQQTNPSGCQ